MKEPRRLVILATILVGLGAAIFSQHNGETELGVDGSYYFQVARHVAAGRGLVTSVCLYHQGLKRLPAKTNIYPLWPLLLGGAGRVMGMTNAARLLPRLIFLVDLLLLYLLTLRVAERTVGLNAVTWKGFDVGHLVVLLFGCNPIFFSSASYPYTEALAFLMIFASLLAMERSGGLAGALAALAFLTRSQNIVFAAALLGALLIVRRWRSAGAFAAAFLIVIMPWVAFLMTFIKPFTPAALIGMYSETPQLPMFDQSVPVHGLTEWIAERVRGALVAFNPASEMSFVHSFGLAALLVPLAAIHAVWRRVRGVSLMPLAVLLSGAALSFVLIFVHQRFFLQWLFGYRHGLPFILLLMLALVELIGRGEIAARSIAVTVSIISIATGALTIARTSIWHPHAWPPAEEAQLTIWLMQHDPNAIVLSTHAQVLSAISGGNFRWAACQEDPQEIRQVISLVKTDYVAAYDGEQACPFLRGLVGRELEIIAIFGQAPRRLFLMRVRRPPPTSSAPPSTPGG